MFAKCPILWTSQIALSTTEAEYMAPSSSLREALPPLELIEEIRIKEILDIPKHAKNFCKCFAENSGALELANTSKMRPRTKHINILYHHFREAVQNNRVKIHAIDVQNQIADILTKPLNQNLFTKHRKKLILW